MRTRAAATSVLCLAFGLLVAAPARAQYAPKGVSDRATGETYHVEIGYYFWNPTPEIAITSEALGIIGSRIDFISDLGIEQKRFGQLKVVLRPAKKHKFRFEYTPISYQATGTLSRDIIFNGIKYPIALPVNTDFKWNAYRFGYEWDFVYTDRGFLGLVLEAKYTDVQTTLTNVLDTEFVQAQAPIPAIGAIGRVYVAPNISITGEFTGFKLPDSINEDYRAKYFDFDVYGTVNFTDHAGAQVGYRSFNVVYKVKRDDGELNLKGLYFGGAVRF
jgi:hypothetical protein